MIIMNDNFLVSIFLAENSLLKKFKTSTSS